MLPRLFDDPLHLVLLLVVILIVFGAGKLPGVGAALGQSIKEFKKASTEDDEAKAVAALPGNTCPKCQASNPVGAQFCTGCGSPLQPQVAAASEAEVFCSKCGTKNGGNSRFCAACGTELSVRTT
jgi:TatA/E family protein of Tat protein translocase